MDRDFGSLYRFLNDPYPDGPNFYMDRITSNLENLKQLAVQYGLPVAPNRLPEVGEGGVYSRTRYNKWLAGVVLGVIFCGLFLISRTDLGFRVLQGSHHQQGSGPPEPMA